MNSQRETGALITSTPTQLDISGQELITFLCTILMSSSSSFERIPFMLFEITFFSFDVFLPLF